MIENEKRQLNTKLNSIFITLMKIHIQDCYDFPEAMMVTAYYHLGAYTQLNRHDSHKYRHIYFSLFFTANNETFYSGRERAEVDESILHKRNWK